MEGHPEGRCSIVTVVVPENSVSVYQVLTISVWEPVSETFRGIRTRYGVSVSMLSEFLSRRSSHRVWTLGT